MIKPLIGIGSDVLHPSQSGERDRAFVYMTYVEALRSAGAMPVLIPPQAENAAELVEDLDGLLLAGGDDCDPRIYGEEPLPGIEPMDPRRQSNDLSLARISREKGIPTLGICLGMQVMNVAAGGSLVQDIDSQLGTDINHVSPPSNRARHEVTVSGGSRLAEILGERDLQVNSSHHQSVKTPGRGLTVTASAPDTIVEAMEDPSHPFYLGVQWHPEDMPGEESATRLFGAFVAAARKRADKRREAAAELSPAAAGAAE
jgi:putative glutamine amidotransferase